MKYICRTYSSDEDWNGDCDYLLIDISEAVAKKIQEYMAAAGEMRKKFDTFYCLDIFDYSCQAFEYFEGAGDLLDVLGSFDAADVCEAPEGFEIPDEHCQRTECDTVEAQENRFKWKMYVKHTSVEISSPMFEAEILERIIKKELV